MPSALPPVTDCGCATSVLVSPSPGTGDCCFQIGVANPNTAGVLPPDTTVWSEYRQLADLVAGPVQQLWYWNPNLAVWQ